MSIGKVIEISSRSNKSFDDAIEDGIARASKTVKGIQGAWVSEMKVDVDDGKVTGYQVNLRVTFLVKD
jgi:flavin-binding protein dodecin